MAAVAQGARFAVGRSRLPAWLPAVCMRACRRGSEATGGAQSEGAPVASSYERERMTHAPRPRVHMHTRCRRGQAGGGDLRQQRGGDERHGVRPGLQAPGAVVGGGLRGGKGLAVGGWLWVWLQGLQPGHHAPGAVVGRGGCFASGGVGGACGGGGGCVTPGPVCGGGVGGGPPCVACPWHASGMALWRPTAPALRRCAPERCSCTCGQRGADGCGQGCRTACWHPCNHLPCLPRYPPSRSCHVPGRNCGECRLRAHSLITN